MPDDASAGADQAASTTTTTGDGAQVTVTQTDDDATIAAAQNPDAVRNAIARHADAAKEAKERADSLAVKVKEFEDRDRTEAEKLTAARDEAKAEADTQAKQNLRLRVALEKQLPSELIDRLKGDSKEEIETDADELLKLVKPISPGFDGGARRTADADDMNALIRRAAGRG